MKTKILLLLLSIFTIGSFNQSNAQEVMLAEVKIFAGNFAPRGWMKCEGQLLPIAEYSALFSLIGTTYGGDGRTTFGLPDMRGRVTMGTGNGPGLSPSTWGQRKGQEQVSLTTGNLPAHNHMAQIPTVQNEPVEVMPARDPDSGSVTVGHPLGESSSNVQTMNTGNNIPVYLMQPSISMTYIICVSGYFPSRS